MSISPIFAFAPVPLTSDLSPLAHAAILIRRRQAETNGAHSPTRERSRSVRKLAEAIA